MNLTHDPDQPIVSTQQPEVHKMLALSTSHLSEYTCEVFLYQNQTELPAYRKDEYGWFFPLDNSFAQPVPGDLQTCIEYARDVGCTWIMFDRDVDPLPQLPTYEW